MPELLTKSLVTVFLMVCLWSCWWWYENGLIIIWYWCSLKGLTHLIKIFDIWIFWLPQYFLKNWSHFWNTLKMLLKFKAPANVGTYLASMASDCGTQKTLLSMASELVTFKVSMGSHWGMPICQWLHIKGCRTCQLLYKAKPLTSTASLNVKPLTY